MCETYAYFMYWIKCGSIQWSQTEKDKNMYYDQVDYVEFG